MIVYGSRHPDLFFSENPKALFTGAVLEARRPKGVE